MKKKVLGLLMAAVLCLCLLPVGAAADGDVTVMYDGVDEASGDIKRSGGGSHDDRVAGVDADGVQVLHVADGDDVALVVAHDLVLDLFPAGDALFHQDLMDGGKAQAVGTDLCANATLTVNGALIHTGGTKFSIYGQTQPNTAARWSGSF